jgi:tRNA1(Val) A37 N6-methylase TrmN6
MEPLFRGTGKEISILDIGAGHGFFGMVAARSNNLRLSKYICVEKDKVLGESLKKT